MVPALLPPPAPFKLFVLAAGVAEVRPLQFVSAIAVARGARYLALGVLAIYYGDAALELMRTRGRDVGALAGRRSSCSAAGAVVASRQTTERAEAAWHRVTVELSIVIPLRDEEPNVAPLHEELTRVLGSMGRPVRGDPASTTAARTARSRALRRHPGRRSAACACIRFTRNFGQTAAFAAGFAARARRVHRHLRRRPAERPGRHPAPARRWPRTHDIVCGWRRDRKDDFLTRHLPSVVANWLIGAGQRRPRCTTTAAR